MTLANRRAQRRAIRLHRRALAAWTMQRLAPAHYAVRWFGFDYHNVSAIGSYHHWLN